MAAKSFRFALLLLSLILLETAVAAADPFEGEFSGSLDGKTYRLSISSFARGRYDGEFHADGQRMALSARRFGERIAGQIANADSRFGFTAEPSGGGLLMRDESGRVIRFRRDSGGGAVGGD